MCQFIVARTFINCCAFYCCFSSLDISILYNTTSTVVLVVAVFLPLSTEVNFTPSLGLDFPDEGFMMLLSGILIVQLLFKPNSFPTSVLRHPLFLIVVLQFLWLVVVCFYSYNSLLSVKFMLARIWYILPFVVLPQLFLNTPTQLKKQHCCCCCPWVLWLCNVY
jgi:hypothetical protein